HGGTHQRTGSLYLKSSAMSASTQRTATLPETQQFPGNCTLEMALKTIVDVYHRYSIREGQLDLLNFNDFRTLLTEQAPTFLQDRNKREYLRTLFEETDLNKDSELTFEEFTIVLAKLTDDHHLKFTESFLSHLMHGEGGHQLQQMHGPAGAVG
uniref:EF-hand domain-containing protein n=1 Tax=Aquila chrysaetos chrysaetos TaxID=223781 RepID=A0A663DZF3_AQUCH